MCKSLPTTATELIMNIAVQVLFYFSVLPLVGPIG
jgi:hypothetical protein